MSELSLAARVVRDGTTLAAVPVTVCTGWADDRAGTAVREAAQAIGAAPAG